MLTPFEVISSLWMPFRRAVYEDQIRFDAAIRRKDDGAIAHSARSLDAFGEVYFLGLKIRHLAQPPVELGISGGITRLYLVDNKNNGGEGGIRTLGTGVSPYNGLANSTRPLPIAWNQPDKITSDAPSRAESGCSSPLYAPQCTLLHSVGSVSGAKPEAWRLCCPIDHLRPHPTYARHKLSVDARTTRLQSGLLMLLFLQLQTCIDHPNQSISYTSGAFSIYFTLPQPAPSHLEVHAPSTCMVRPLPSMVEW